MCAVIHALERIPILTSKLHPKFNLKFPKLVPSSKFKPAQAPSSISSPRYPAVMLIWDHYGEELTVLI